MTMTLPSKLKTASFYRLRYSRIALGAELVILTLIAGSIINLLDGYGFILTGLLFVLLTILFFQFDSSLKKIPPGSGIEIRKSRECLIWHEHERSTRYPFAEIKIFITRWFILLQLGEGKALNSKLLLVDSFADINHYTCFRRQLIEMNLC